MKQVITLAIGITLLTLLIGAIAFQIDFTFTDDYCSVCDWNYHHWQLLDYNDPGHGHAGALQEIWESANYGKQVDLEWYENYRLKYNLTSVDSFTLINYSNSRPSSPDLKWMDTGLIQEFEYDPDPFYKDLTEVYIIVNNVTYHWKVASNWNPSQENISREYFIFKQKDRAWHWHYRGAKVIDAFVNSNYANDINASWDKYYNDYQNYLDNGGVDKGDDYWM